MAKDINIKRMLSVDERDTLLLPDVLIIQILSFLPKHSYLPIAHVSKKFRSLWIWIVRKRLGLPQEQGIGGGIQVEKLQQQQRKTHSYNTYDRTKNNDLITRFDGMKKQREEGDKHERTNICNNFKIQMSYLNFNGNCADDDFTSSELFMTTSPLSIGNLFEYFWNVRSKKNTLNKNLLRYYFDNGYGIHLLPMIKHKSHPEAEELQIKNNFSNINSMLKIMCECAKRGDIQGMSYIVSNRFILLDHEDICTMAAAAGHLKALKWLRGDLIVEGTFDTTMEGCECPWNPTEVHREAAENSHEMILEYVEKNSECHEIQVHYGVGLPW